MKISIREQPEIIEKLNQEICISVFTYNKHNKSKIIRTLKKIDEVALYKIVSYNHFEEPINQDVYDLADIVVSTHKTMMNVNFPWFWHMKNCIILANEMDFKYIFFMCGDTYVGRPDRILKLPKILGDDDIMTYGYSKKGAVGTFCWFAKMSVLLKLHKEMNKDWQGTPTGSVGIKLGRLVKSLGLKVKEYKEMDTPQMFKFKKGFKRSCYSIYLELEHL